MTPYDRGGGLQTRQAAATPLRLLLLLAELAVREDVIEHAVGEISRSEYAVNQ